MGSSLSSRLGVVARRPAGQQRGASRRVVPLPRPALICAAAAEPPSWSGPPEGYEEDLMMKAVEWDSAAGQKLAPTRRERGPKKALNNDFMKTLLNDCKAGPLPFFR